MKLLCEDYIKYLSNTYVDFQGVSQIGESKLNEYLNKFDINYQLFDSYSNGYQANFSNDFCMVLQPSNSFSKNSGYIGAYAYEENIDMKLDLTISSDKDLLYVLSNKLPILLDLIFVEFINGLETPYYDLNFSTTATLIGDDYNSVSSVSAIQNISVNRQINVKEQLNDL